MGSECREDCVQAGRPCAAQSTGRGIPAEGEAGLLEEQGPASCVQEEAAPVDEVVAGHIGACGIRDARVRPPLPHGARHADRRKVTWQHVVFVDVFCQAVRHHHARGGFVEFMDERPETFLNAGFPCVQAAVAGGVRISSERGPGASVEPGEAGLQMSHRSSNVAEQAGLCQVVCRVGALGESRKAPVEKMSLDVLHVHRAAQMPGDGADTSAVLARGAVWAVP